jgi:site-specific recombinase XerD
MLYETCARAEELLQLNIEDLDLAGRSAPVKSKGAEPRTRRRGATTANTSTRTPEPPGCYRA